MPGEWAGSLRAGILWGQGADQSRYTGTVNRQRKNPGAPGRRVAKVGHGGRVGMGDAASKALQKAGVDLGNAEMISRVQDPKEIRDEFLKAITSRLKGIRSAQLKEDAARRDPRNLHRRAIYRGEDHQADPGRWRDVARKFLDAARALCAGQLDKGARILEEAYMMEKQAYDSLPEHVDVELEQEDRRGGALPASIDQIASGATCPACTLPGGIELASWIENLDPKIPLRGVKGKNPHNWWDEEQEEAEDEGDE